MSFDAWMRTEPNGEAPDVLWNARPSSLAQTAEAGIAGAAERQSGTQPLPAKPGDGHQAVQDATTGEF